MRRDARSAPPRSCQSAAATRPPTRASSRPTDCRPATAPRRRLMTRLNEKRQLQQAKGERAERHVQLRRAGALRNRVLLAGVVQTAIDASEPEREHRQEDRVHRDERAPEVEHTEPVIERASGDFREPVIDAGEDREDACPARRRSGSARRRTTCREATTSLAASPSGSPVRPPSPNIGRNASAKSIGVVKRIAPPHSDSTREVTSTTDGIEIIIVVIWKNALDPRSHAGEEHVMRPDARATSRRSRSSPSTMPR